MAISGIIAEFNPLHKGHKFIIDAARAEGNTVVCVISGNFVQRGDTSVISKFKRAEAALKCGADLVAELPVPWSMSTAQNFALGGVAQLMALGCDEIVFGSECGDITQLQKAVEILESDSYSEFLAEELSCGISFAAAREKAAIRSGLDSAVLSSPNDTLGIEYITAAKHLGYTGGFRCVKRIGAEHDSKELNPKTVSASLIREKLVKGDIGFAERFIPLELRGFLRNEIISDISNIDKCILAVLRTKPQEYFASLPDISEGLENKLYFSVRVATSFEELCSMVKTKRYSLARIRRLVLSAFLGIDNTFFGKVPPYVRVLGFSPDGKAQLGNIKNDAIPVVTRAAEIKKLDSIATAVFETECRATDLYSLSLTKPQECGAEYKAKLLKTECLT